MIEWACPWFLVLLPAIPLAAWLTARGSAGGAIDFSSGQLLGDSPGQLSCLARHGGRLLRWLSLALVVLALARPRLADEQTRIRLPALALMILVDASGSMADRDFFSEGQPVRRWDAVDRSLREFLAESPSGRDRASDLMGLITFASRPEVICPLTQDHRALLRLLGVQKPHENPGESETNLADAITLGLDRLDGAPVPRRVLLLISDGENNAALNQSGWSPIQSARAAELVQVPIYCLDVGPPPEDMPEGDERTSRRTRAREMLRDLARTTGGSYWPAGEASSLNQALEQFQSLERSDSAGEYFQRYHELYPWLALAAFAMMVLALTLEQTIWRGAT
ncbi:MAG: vWA domain-containing protein [Gemmataceae bacterium]